MFRCVTYIKLYAYTVKNLIVTYSPFQCRRGRRRRSHAAVPPYADDFSEPPPPKNLISYSFNIATPRRAAAEKSPKTSAAAAENLSASTSAEEEELHVSNSADLLHLMSQNPQPHDVFIRVGIPEAADFPMPTKLRFANMFHNLAANIYEMYIRGNILTILLPEPNFDLVFGDWDTNGLECDKDFTRRNLDIQLQRRLLFLAGNTMLARTLTPEFYDLQESGIIHWWENRNADKDILSPSKFYTDKTYFGTHLHRALIHWPPKKSPEFEKDIVRLDNAENIEVGYSHEEYVTYGMPTNS
ncbi:hypothetical protein Fcan01_19016 [Folsomia candida]|uniref:Uncharacterized protein n=1 Tax=Folsomia candida TaxID=158441 RepID=A0A226DMI2_FOLCA|nr:hypothetical protein Fcan01_19016 [Folsomia candida]